VRGSGSSGGRIYLWNPPPAPLSNAVPLALSEFIQCSGVDISPGAPQGFVLDACGAPSATRQVIYATQRGEQVIDVWSYARPNAVTRTLRFEGGILTSIDTVGAMNR
jgi:hypothetical protein